MLDALLAHAVVVDGDWDSALERCLQDPRIVVVTRRGDRFGATGWRLRAAGSGATGAALDEARTRAEQTSRQRDEARRAMEAARAAVAGARGAEQQAARDRDTAESRRRSLTDSLERLGPRHR